MNVVRPRFRSGFGFTLIELMVAIGMSAVVAVGMYALSLVASQTFQQQQRISEVQMRVRSAMEMLRADIARAGYMASPATATDPMVCPRPAVAMQAIYARRDNPNPTHEAASNLFISPARIELVGNFTSSDVYRVMAISGRTVYLQNRTAAYARFANESVFEQVFENQFVQITGSNGMSQTVQVTDAEWTAPGSASLPYLELAAAPVVIGAGGAGCGIPGLGVGATIAPVSGIAYRVVAGANVFAEGVPTSTGRTDLVRETLAANAMGGFESVAGSARVVAEYAVDLDVSVTVDTAVAGAPEPLLTRYEFGDARVFTVLARSGAAGAAPERVRAVGLRLSVRERVQDPDFAWVARSAATDPLTRFRVFTNQIGASRVRTLTTEVELPNIAFRNLRP